MEYFIIFIQPQKIMNMPLPTVNARKLSFKNNEYVCWIDIMGTRNIMSESVSKAANSIFKLHSCVMDCIDEDGDATFYPLMDGVFITSPNYGKIFLIIDKLFSRFADIMAYLLYQWVYAEETKKVPGYSKRPVFQNK